MAIRSWGIDMTQVRRAKYVGLLCGIVFEATAVMAHGQQAKPTDADVDRAIRACSLGQKLDTKVEAALTVLKRRILSGSVGVTDCEIRRGSRLAIFG